MRFLFLSFGFLLIFAQANSQRLIRTSLGLTVPVSKNCTPVKDQAMSSTCWSFSSTSFIESELMKLGKPNINLSEMFIARYSMMRKIERHLAVKGQNFFTPGGQFHDAVWVMKNYGIVPEGAYSGKGRGELNHDHGEMDTVLSRFVRRALSNHQTALTASQKDSIEQWLDYYYGPVPKSFVYQGQSYTPQTYLKDYLKVNMDDFVEITSYTHHPYYTKFILEDKYNWTSDEYFNVSLDDFSAITNNAIAKGYTVGWDGDADDEYFDYIEGLAYMPEPIKDLTVARQSAFMDKSTLLNHMMHIIDRVEKDGKTWYFVKNSWGASNTMGGYLWMREDYFIMRTLAIIVNKAAIPDSIRKKMGL